MGAAVEIRTIQPSDSLVELTRVLHAAYARLGAMGLNYTAVDQSLEVTAKRVSSGVCFVALSEGRIVGTIVVQHPRDDDGCPYFARANVASAHQFAVAPPHQGRGIGARLLDQAEAWAIGSGYTELALDTAELAHHLIALYQRRGYVHVGFAQWEGKRYRSVLMAEKVGHAV